MRELETLLLTMTAHGKPNLSLTSTGWHCGVDMTVPHTGVAVTVRSEFNHITPLEAAQACMDRIRAIGATEARERALSAKAEGIGHG